METDSDAEPEPNSTTNAELETDGGVAAGVTTEELYTVVHTAVKDALIDVLATIFLLGLGLAFVAAGIGSLADGSSGLELVFAGGSLGFGLVLIAAAFDLVPSFHERFLD